MNSISLRRVLMASLLLAASSLFATPTPISSCMTISAPGPYALVNNITASGNCLIVGADFVTIDFDGFTMTGNGTTGFGVKDDGITRSGITIRGGTIRNFYRGININGYVVVENMFVSSCVNYGILLSSGLSVVRNNWVNGNNDGIGVGIRSIVSGNNSSGNKGTGIVASDGCTITGNTAGQNGNNGIYTTGNSVISNNTANLNGNYGIGGWCPSTVIANAATNNTNGDILLSGTGCTRSQNAPAP